MRYAVALRCSVAVLVVCLAGSAALAAPPARPQVSMPRLPLTFERNTGHWPRQVEFVARTGQGALFLTKREMVLALRGKGRSAALRLKLQGSSPKAVASGVKKLPGIVNYFIGNDPKRWRTRVPTYSGAHTATAAFAGDAWYAPATESTTFNVVP